MLWRLCTEDKELARLQIASKRLLLDDTIHEIRGVQFFFSCISSVCFNSKTRNDKDGKTSKEVYPSVSYFIVYAPDENCNNNTFFTALQNKDLEPTIQPLKVRSGGSSEMEMAAKQLFQTVKDHNNKTIIEMLDLSNVYCYKNASDGLTHEDSNEDNKEFHPKHFPTVPCVFMLVNDNGYFDTFHSVIDKLRSDGLVVETASVASTSTPHTLSDTN